MKIILPGLLATLCLGCGYLQQDTPHLPMNSAQVIDLDFEGDFNGTSNEWYVLQEDTPPQFHIIEPEAKAMVTMLKRVIFRY